MTDFLFGFHNKCTFLKLIGILLKILSIHVKCTFQTFFLYKQVTFELKVKFVKEMVLFNFMKNTF